MLVFAKSFYNIKGRRDWRIQRAFN